MATYIFRAIDVAGVQARGEMEADSKQAVTEQLRSRGMIPLGIDAKKGSVEINLSLMERVKLRDISVMTRQLSTMVSSGMTILRALYVLEEQTESKKLKEALGDVRKDVEAGLGLSDSMERHPKVFSPLYVAMVRSGETGGLLESTLLRVADQLESEDSLRRQVKSAMVYPTVVVTFAMIVMLALVAFIVPVFEKIFDDFGSELPALTKFTTGISHLVTDRWYVMIIVTFAVVFSFLRWKRSDWGRPQWDRFKLRVPLKIGDVVQKVCLARWSRTFSALMHAGVPILQAMEGVVESVKRGGTINAPLKQAPIFPGMVVHMVGVGEETGSLDAMLSKIADFYEAEVDAAIKALTSILEPVMIILIGGIVGFIVISLYLPMFKVYDTIK
jgi:type IV pilus assembly protein PilC